MAFLETHVFSQALEVAVTVNVLLPEPSQGIGLEGVQVQEPPRVMYPVSYTHLRAHET